MKLSVVTDELSADLETALEVARELGLDGVELRGIGQARYPFVTDLERVRVPQLLAEAGLPVAAISPGLFKIPFPSPAPVDTRILRWEDAAVFARTASAEALVRRHLEVVLPESIDAARAIGAPTIVAFSFDRGNGQAPGRAPDGVVDVLRDAARLVAAAGLVLAIEVEHICWGDTAARTAELIGRVGHPAIGINWDPANAYRAGDDRPFPDGYAAVRELVRHVHAKDAGIDPATGQRGFRYEGIIDWPGQIEALARDGYTGFVSIEPHERPKIALARRYVERLRGAGVRP